MSTVHEVCSCGARFDFTSNDFWHSDVACRVAVKAWREQHRHEMPTPKEERHEQSLD
jgi:hypothetical protein